MGKQWVSGLVSRSGNRTLRLEAFVNGGLQVITVAHPRRACHPKARARTRSRQRLGVALAVAAAVDQGLPLPHHPHVLVVCTFHLPAVPCWMARGHLLDVHQDGRVTADADHGF